MDVGVIKWNLGYLEISYGFELFLSYFFSLVKKIIVNLVKRVCMFL